MLVTMKALLDRASNENYAVAAPNVSNELEARAFAETAEEINAPLIFNVAFSGMISHPDIYMFGKILRDLAFKSNVPIAVNLDHGKSKAEVIACIQAGFTSVMIDKSTSPLEENIKIVREITEIAHSIGISVEAELGHVGMANNYAHDRDAALTNVQDAVTFIRETNIDCLAVAIGTAHGMYPEGFVPYLDFRRLKEIKEATGNFPLVMHGSSGTDSNDLKKACQMGINKVNVGSDLFRAAADAVSGLDLNGSGAFSLYSAAITAAKTRLKELIKIYGSAGKAWMPEPTGLTDVALNPDGLEDRPI